MSSLATLEKPRPVPAVPPPAAPKPGALSRLWRTLRDEEVQMGYLFILPSVLIFSIFVVLPVLIALYLSFTNTEIYNIPGPFIGLKNYQQVFTYDVFWRSMLNAALMTIINVPIGLFLAFSTAIFLNERRLHGRLVYRMVYLIPMTGSAVVSSMIWLWIYYPEPAGVLNSILLRLGLIQEHIAWLGDPRTALPAVLFAGWFGFGFNMLIYLSAIQGIPESLYKAAAIDGASRWQTLRNVTWPLVKPATFFMLVMALVHIFEAGFTSVYILTKGGPIHTTEVATHLIYQTGFGVNQLGYAAAQSFVLFLCSFVITLLLWPQIKAKQEMYV